MINDRTEAFKEALKNMDNRKVRDDVAKGAGQQKKMTAEFFEEVEEISHCLEKIESDVEEVKKKFNSALSCPETDEKTKFEIESTTAEIKKLGMKVRKHLKSMEYTLETKRKENDSSAEYRIRMTQHSALSKRLVDLMFEYNKVQTAYRERYKNRIRRELEVVGKIKTDEEIEEMLESRKPAIFTQDILIETSEAKRALADIEDRYADIMKLEKSIRELNELFMDINFLVSTQGELVDQIEYNVQSAVNFVETGAKEMRKARRHRKKVRRRKIILVVVVLVIVVTGVVIGILV